MKNIRLLLLFAVCGALLFSACDSTEGEGSGILEPSSTEAKVSEGYICGWVDENLRPMGIDNEFLQGDVVHIWLAWENVTGQHEIKIAWVKPNDDVEVVSSKVFESETGMLETYFWLDTSATAPTGRWLAEVYLDDEFLRSYAFWIFTQ